jgi:hypothetical protein
MGLCRDHPKKTYKGEKRTTVKRITEVLLYTRKTLGVHRVEERAKSLRLNCMNFVRKRRHYPNNSSILRRQ